MAAEDYTVTGDGAHASSATLAASITHATTSLSISGLSFTDEEIVVGSAVMINNEIMRMVSLTSSTLVVARGCADTIPQSHDVGSTVWFFSTGVESDETEYGVGESVGVKMPVRTTSEDMTIENAPPHGVTFVGRFIRPYPPGFVRIDGSAFYNAHTLNAANPELTLTWVHRDRVIQANVLVEHGAASVGPEPGTTYTVRIYAASAPTTVLREVAGITGLTWTYTVEMAAADLGVPIGGSAGNTNAIMELLSVRDGHESYQTYRIPFVVNLDGVSTSGWGFAWGASWG